MNKVFIFLMLVVYVKVDVTHGMYTNRNYQVPWDSPPVYNHTTTSTPRPDAVIELTFHNLSKVNRLFALHRMDDVSVRKQTRICTSEMGTMKLY